MPRLLKTGMLVALLAFLTLGGMSAIGTGKLGVPTAHAASTCGAPPDSGPHAEAAIQSLQHPDPNNPNYTTSMSGVAYALLNADFDQYGNYCGYMTVDAHASLDPGSHGGYLWGGLYNCSGQYETGTNVVLMTNHSLNWDTIESSKVYQTCGYVVLEVWYFDQNHNKVFMSAVSSEW
jgi:hypothetical protein